MAKKGGNKGGGKATQRRDRRLTQRATRNVELLDAPQANLLQQQLQQAQQDYLRQQQAAQSIWGGASEAMQGLPAPDFGSIAGTLNQNLGTVSDMFGGAGAGQYMAPGEAGAGQALGAAYGTAGHGMLANAAEREAGFRSSAEREGVLSQRFAQDNLLQQLQDTLKGYNNQMGQIRADDPWQIQQEADRLRQQSIEDRLAQQKMQSDRAFSQWLQDYAGGLGNNVRPPGGGGGGGGGQPQPQSQAPRNPQVAGPTGNAPHGASHPRTGGEQMDMSPNTPWINRLHPMFDYTHGNLAKGFGELQQPRQDWLRNNIVKYGQTHPNAFPGLPMSSFADTTQQAPPEQAGMTWEQRLRQGLVSARDLLSNVERRYYG